MDDHELRNRMPVQRPAELLEILRMPGARFVLGPMLHPQDRGEVSEEGRWFLGLARDSIRSRKAFDLGLLPRPGVDDLDRARAASVTGQIAGWDCTIAFVPTDRDGLATGPAQAFIVRDCGGEVEFVLVEGLPAEEDLPAIRVLLGGTLSLHHRDNGTRSWWLMASHFPFTWAIERLLGLLADATAAHYGEYPGVNAFSDPHSPEGARSTPPAAMPDQRSPAASAGAAKP